MKMMKIGKRRILREEEIKSLQEENRIEITEMVLEDEPEEDMSDK